MYLPTGNSLENGPAASYPIPPQNPQGEVYVTSFGFTDMDSPSQQAGALLHVRLAVSNGSGTPWSLDVRNQTLLVVGQGLEPPTYVNAESGSGPVYQVLPGRAGVFDLYYRLPPGQDKASQLGGFSLNWKVDAGGQPVADVTAFQRYPEEPQMYEAYPPYVSVGLDWGLGWWGVSPLFPGRGPYVHHYYYPPGRVHGGPWRGPRPGGFHGGPPGGFHGGGRGAGRR